MTVYSCLYGIGLAVSVFFILMYLQTSYVTMERLAIDPDDLDAFEDYHKVGKRIWYSILFAIAFTIGLLFTVPGVGRWL